MGFGRFWTQTRGKQVVFSKAGKLTNSKCQGRQPTDNKSVQLEVKSKLNMLIMIDAER